ncbi:DNA topoisomerase [Pararhizobium sp. BT-229]|uniref:DNA topoisomerase n=1 Tax=Pararhizobium sp. BT-229 TaxID=2986923 RepID=UPI0021F7BD9A|nr:DNA topoisomerase [Pararhizobium sp. BT-229]MCV9964186.1 DNA topoisomerase [Pararhizobium sp. BT-229]
MPSVTLEKVSHGLNLDDLVKACATRFDMTPAATLAVAGTLYDDNAISYPRTEARYIGEDRHIEGAATLMTLAAASPIWEAMVENTDALYQSSVWFNSKDFDWNAYAIRPLATANVASFSKDEENVFSVIAERYVALFDPARSTPRDAAAEINFGEYRRFVAARHAKVVDVFGEPVDLVGPEFFIDNRDGSIFLAVHDGVSGNAWLEVPIAAVSEFVFSMPFSSTADFARRNLPLLRKFVDEANNTVLPDGGGLYVCASGTYEVRDGLRHYMWPRK